MKVETNYLKTIKNYAVANKVTTTHIYNLVKSGEIEAVYIDGIQFIDTSVYPKVIRKR